MRDNIQEDLFADHAWQEMHKVLDREMPERKRRGAFWLWFLPAFGLCVLLGRDSLLKDKTPVAVEKPQQNQPAIAQVKEHTVPNTTQNNKTNSEEQKVVTKQQAPSNIAVIANPASTIASGKAEKASRSGSDKHLGEKPSLSVATALSPKSIEPLPAKVLNEQTNKSSGLVYTEEGLSGNDPKDSNQHSIAQDEASIERWNSTEMLATRQAELGHLATELEKVSVKPTRAKQKLEWWAEAGTQLASGTDGLSGYRMGMLSAIPMGRMRLQTGLAYEKTEVGFQSIQRDFTGKENQANVIVSNKGLDMPTTTASGNRNTSQSVSSITLQFLNFNLALHQPIGKRWGIALGGNLHYLGGIKLGENYLRSTLFDQAENTYRLESNGFMASAQSNDLSKASFNAFGFSAQGAISYRIATRWSASLGYRQSLQHFTKTSDLLLQPNWVDLGIRYRLK